MTSIVVVDRPDAWPEKVGDATVVRALDYLSDRRWADGSKVRLVNISGDYRYQGIGYYVSLVAEARGHHVLPSVGTIQDFKMRGVAKVLSEDLDDLIQKSLSDLKADEFVLSVYFGENLAKRHARLAKELFRLFPAPLVIAKFRRGRGQWRLQRVQLLPPKDIPKNHRDFVFDAAERYLQKRHHRRRHRLAARFDAAIYVDPQDATPPSDEMAIKQFAKAFERAGFACDVIGPDDIPGIGEYDALFIRATTNVHHRTYRLARRAETAGLVVVDDPVSILRCTNKVYLAELLQKHNVPAPQSWIAQADNLAEIEAQVQYPCVLKQPDSAYSLGVMRCEDRDDFFARAKELLESSELLVVQSYMPTSFDWRIGIIDRQPIYACRYHMVRNHWQIAKHTDGVTVDEGESDGVPLGKVPDRVLKTALKAAGLIGDGLYGVDIKEFEDGKVVVVEVNDNPSMDAGIEDEIAGRQLYDMIAGVFLKRVEARTRGRGI